MIGEDSGAVASGGRGSNGYGPTSAMLRHQLKHRIGRRRRPATEKQQPRRGQQRSAQPPAPARKHGVKTVTELIDQLRQLFVLLAQSAVRARFGLKHPFLALEASYAPLERGDGPLGGPEIRTHPGQQGSPSFQFPAQRLSIMHDQREPLPHVSELCASPLKQGRRASPYLVAKGFVVTFNADDLLSQGGKFAKAVDIALRHGHPLALGSHRRQVLLLGNCSPVPLCRDCRAFPLLGQSVEGNAQVVLKFASRRFEFGDCATQGLNTLSG